MDDFLRVGLELPALAPRPARGTPGSWASGWLEVAEVAAGAPGIGALWLTGGPGAASEPTCDPCTLAGGLVGTVPSAVLGVVSVIGCGRHPSVLARDLTALDVVSGGRAAVLLRLPEHPVPGAPVAGGAAWEQLVEATTVCRAVLTEERPHFEGHHFHVTGAVNRPPPVRAGGPPVLVELPIMTLSGAGVGDAEPGAAFAALAHLVDAIVVGGGQDEVAACRRLLDRTGVGHQHQHEADPGSRPGRHRLPATLPPPLVWRGAAEHLGTAPAQVATQARALLDAGADGLVLRVDARASGALAAAVGVLTEALVAATGRWAR